MKIVYVDDNAEARSLYTRILGAVLSDAGCEFISICPEIKINQMITKISQIDNLVSIILDERISESGTADYDGMVLAEKLRVVYPKIPIYILTNFVDVAESYEDLELNIEYILNKGDISDPVYKKRAVARILRHINVYRDIITERNNRFQELLKKSISQELTPDELAEYQILDELRLLPVLHDELSLTKQLQSQVQENEALVKDINKLLSDSE